MGELPQALWRKKKVSAPIVAELVVHWLEALGQKSAVFAENG